MHLSNEPHDAVALFDMDGTLCDFDAAMKKALESLSSPGEVLPDNPFSDEVPWLRARRRLIRRSPGFWENLPRFQLGFDVLEIAQELEFECHILTKGPASSTNAWEEKVLWCQREVPELPITISMKKSLMYGKVLVDDWPDYFLPWLLVRPRGLVVCPAHPWNEGIDHPNVVRYDGSNLGVVRHRLSAARATAKWFQP